MAIAASGLIRFIRYGGVSLIRTFSSAERANLGLWTLTHVCGIAGMLLLAVGISKRKGSFVVTGALLFVLVCFYSWLRPMDFLWFGS